MTTIRTTSRAEFFTFHLLDIQLPEMDGFAVAKELKQHPETADIPIIAVTS